MEQTDDNKVSKSTSSNAVVANELDIAQKLELNPTALASPSPSPPYLQYNITNVMSSFDLSCKVSVARIVRLVEGARRTSKGASQIQLSGNNGEAKVFPTGKVIGLSTQDETVAYLAANELVETIKNLGYGVKLGNFEILSINATYNYPRRIKLIKILTNVIDKGILQCINRDSVELLLHKPRVKLNINESGKVVLSDAKSEQEVKDAVTKLYSIFTICE